jgi:hypothetical protein
MVNGAFVVAAAIGRKWKLCLPVFLAVVVHCGIFVGGARYHFPNVDEIAHLPAGVFIWKFGRFDSYVVNPPLVKMVAGAGFLLNSVDDYNWSLHTPEVGSRPEFTIGLDLLNREKLAVQELYFIPRLSCLVFSLAGGFALALVMGHHFGEQVGAIAAVYWFTCPNILANSQTIVPDIGAVCLGVITCSCFCRYLANPHYESAVLSGVTFGVALLTKLTWIVGYFAFPFVALLCNFFLQEKSRRRVLPKQVADLLLFGLCATLVLNLGYKFEGSMRPLGEFSFCSQMLGGEGCGPNRLGNRFADGTLGRLPVPVPEAFLRGIDYLRYEVETKRWSFLLGEWKFGSWLHYYCVTILLKTPEPCLLGALIGCVLLVIGVIKRKIGLARILVYLVFGVIGIAFLGTVSVQGGFNHHHRYVLMIYPFLFALASFVGSPVAGEIMRLRLPFSAGKRYSFALPFAIALVSLSAVSSLRVHPYYTSYFNSVSGGPENGWRLLGFSNIDWGQDILDVEKWIKEHPESRPLVMELSYFDRRVSQSLFSVPAASPRLLPKGASVDEIRRTIDETQWWIISVKELYNKPGQDGLEYLQQLEPVDRIAYSYHVYRIDPLYDTDSAGQARPDFDAKIGSRSDPGN